MNRICRETRQDTESQLPKSTGRHTWYEALMAGQMQKTQSLASAEGP